MSIHRHNSSLYVIRRQKVDGKLVYSMDTYKGNVCTLVAFVILISFLLNWKKYTCSLIMEKSWNGDVS